MEFVDYDEIKTPPLARPPPPPPHFSKKVLISETSPMTKYHTISRLERRSVTQSLSTIKPYKSGRSCSPQPNERSVVKNNSTPSPKPRNVIKIST